MRTLVSRIAVALLAVLLASFARAQPAEDARPRFTIDAIKVTGLRYASERVIVAETRLRPGRAYTEAELHAGAARAARLPFVVRIDLRLERGEARGAYQLLIAVTEAKPVFVGGALQDGGDRDDDVETVTLGSRLFAGRSGVFHAAASAGGDGGFEVGYTQYDLFGTGVFAAATLEHRAITVGETDRSPDAFVDDLDLGERLTMRVVAGIPIGGNHALRASWTREPTVLRNADLVGEEPFLLDHVTTQELAYIYDSTDDPLVPSSGTSLVGTAALRSGPLLLVRSEVGPPLRGDYERPSFSVDARKHWRLAPRHSASAAAVIRHVQRASDTRFGPQTATAHRVSLGGAYAFTIWGEDRPHRFGDLRVEAGAGYKFLRQSTPRLIEETDVLETVRVSRSTPTAFVGLVYRSPWAVIRVRFEAGELEP
ncbi:MAG TPA: hypothetical protein VF846_15425 [Thermoanaerobaculia bacterium]|jgi:hypothetical protein